MQWQLIFDKVSTEGDVREKVVGKFSQLDKYLKRVGGDLRKGMVTMSKGERWGYRVRVGLKLPGKKLVVEGRGKELLSAVDEAYHKSSRRVRKYYERLQERKTKVRKRRG